MRKKVIDWFRPHMPLLAAVAAIGGQRLFGIDPQIPWWVTGALVYLLVSLTSVGAVMVKEHDLHHRRLHDLEKRMAWVTKTDYRAENFSPEEIRRWRYQSPSTYCLFTEEGEQRQIRFEDLPRFQIISSTPGYTLWTDLGVLEEPNRADYFVNGKSYAYKTQVFAGTRQECLAYVLRVAPDGEGISRDARVLFS